MTDINGKKGLYLLKQNAIYVVLIVLIIGIAIKDPRFLTPTCLKDILIQSSTRVIIALGACFAILTGGADLSAGRLDYQQ